MSRGKVVVERRGPVAIITLDRPAKKNALDEGLWSGLREAAAELATDLPRAVILTGAPPAFCAGMDVSPENPQMAGLADAAQSHDPAPMRALLARLRPSFDDLVGLPVPVIAAINGLAYGGGAEVAVRCDLRVMAADATICFSEVRLGLMPDLGGGVALTRLVGPGIAADLILTAREVGAEEALRLGVVNRIAAPGATLDEALALAENIAKNGPRAVRASVDVIRRTPDLDEEAALALERDRAADLMASGECIYGVTALMTRSRPEFPDAS
ncbi:MAG: enoyl-CoA hydratase/isomerase family protein [Polyangiaceae bacterium]